MQPQTTAWKISLDKNIIPIKTYSNLVKLAQTSSNDVTNYKTSLNVKSIYTYHQQSLSN